MINLNNVIENFNTVYKNRNSPENLCFLNSSLELVKDKSQKASFFDIVDALQSRRWKTELTASETSKVIKKLWLEAKLIYDNEPFSMVSKSNLISLFEQSIIEGSFFDQKKLELYSKQVQIYCELLYLYKIIIFAEERLNNLSEKIGIPANLKTYANSLEQKYGKVFTFQKSVTFQLLKDLKYNDPLSFLSVFIEEEKGHIINTYPDLLELFELAEYTPTLSKIGRKKEKPFKQKYSSEMIRKQMFSILKKPVYEDLTIDQNQLFTFTYGFFKDSNSSIEDYQKFIKTNLEKYKERMLPIESDLVQIDNAINYYSKVDFLIFKYIIGITALSEKFTEEIVEKQNPLPIFMLYPITKVQNVYTKTVKKFIGNFKNLYTSLKNNDPTKKNITTFVTCDGIIEVRASKNDPSKKNKTCDGIIELQGSKSDFLQNRSKRFGSENFLKFLKIEQDILDEHFPTLIKKPDNLSKEQTRAQVKKEAESIDSIYSILIKELSKISLNKEIYTLPKEYSNLFSFLGCDSTSLPSSEKMVSFNVKRPSETFFSEQEVQSFDRLISDFEQVQRKIFQEKIETYCNEYLSLKSISLQKPQIVEEESFVSSMTISPEKLVAPPAEKLIPMVKEPKVVEINKLASSAGAIPKKIQAKKLSSPSRKQESTLSENREKTIPKLNSLKDLLPLTAIDKKLSKFHYDRRVNQWIFDPKAALQNPAYKNLTKTIDNQKETLAFHTFPKLIDSLIETKYCQEGEYINKKGKLIRTYDIPGMIIMQSIQHMGHFSYSIDPEIGICFHRCFDSTIKSIPKDQSFSEFQYFSHKNLEVKFHIRDQTIEIYDPVQNIQIYIYLPSE